MLDSLPDVLVVEIFTFMALPFLKSTKAVDKRLANLGRRVLRSSRWHDKGYNLNEMSMELECTTLRMKFPIKVALLEEFLPVTMTSSWRLRCDAVVATIYSLNVVYKSTDKMSLSPSRANALHGAFLRWSKHKWPYVSS